MINVVVKYATNLLDMGPKLKTILKSNSSLVAWNKWEGDLEKT